MKLRLAQEHDCETLAQLDKHSNPMPWSAKQFLLAIHGAHNAVWVAEHEQDILGFIVWQTVCDESELHLIATSPYHRRQGIAKQLMTCWQHHCVVQQVRRLLLEVRASNQVAQQLYRYYGFRDYACRCAYYALPDGTREDAILMELWLC